MIFWDFNFKNRQISIKICCRNFRKNVIKTSKFIEKLTFIRYKYLFLFFLKGKSLILIFYKRKISYFLFFHFIKKMSKFLIKFCQKNNNL